MGLFGGYKLVDFKNKNLTSTPTKINHIYSRTQSLFVKRFVACNLVINGEAYGETDMAVHKDDNNDFIVEVANHILTITSQNMVSAISAGGVTSVNGKDGIVVLKAEDIEVKNSQSVQDNLERIDEEVEGVIDDLAGKQATLVAGSNISITPLPDGTERISASGGGTDYQAGNGINITGDTISIDEQIVAEKTDLPTKTSDLTNDSGFITDSYHDSTKLDATKNAVSTVGGLVTPSTTITSTELVAIGSGNAQERVIIGSGLQLTGSTSPKTLSATGGGGGSDAVVYITTANTYDEVQAIIANKQTPVLNVNDDLYFLSGTYDSGVSNDLPYITFTRECSAFSGGITKVWYYSIGWGALTWENGSYETQEKLTAGTGISIVGNVISSSGGGGAVLWCEGTIANNIITLTDRTTLDIQNAIASGTLPVIHTSNGQVWHLAATDQVANNENRDWGNQFVSIKPSLTGSLTSMVICMAEFTKFSAATTSRTIATRTITLS